MENLLFGVVLGTLAGLHAATWGMYKDGFYERFSWAKYSRSVVLSASFACIAQLVLRWDLSQPAARFVFWGLIYCLERAATEYWKLFFRQEDQRKYVIPMQFGFNAVPMQDTKKRVLIGVGVGLAVVGVFFSIGALEARWGASWPRWLVMLTVGSLFGWISAIGGAWKDAPVEGFELLKFFRSPALAAIWAFIVAQMISAHDSAWTTLAISGEGFTIASIETYKTFFTGNRPCGKFAGKPRLYPEHFEFRQRFVKLYAFISVVVASQFIMALMVNDPKPPLLTRHPVRPPKSSNCRMLAD